MWLHLVERGFKEKNSEAMAPTSLKGEHIFSPSPPPYTTQHNAAIHPPHLTALPPFLPQGLRWLSVAGNRASDRGAYRMAQALRYNYTLEYLDMGFNGITSRGAIVLANGIEQNTTLTDLQVIQRLSAQSSDPFDKPATARCHHLRM